MTALFAGCDLLVVDCLRREPHPTHSHLAMALELIETTGAKRADLAVSETKIRYHEKSRQIA